MVMLLFVCLFLHKLASNKPGMNWAPTQKEIVNMHEIQNVASYWQKYHFQSILYDQFFVGTRGRVIGHVDAKFYRFEHYWQKVKGHTP